MLLPKVLGKVLMKDAWRKKFSRYLIINGCLIAKLVPDENKVVFDNNGLVPNNVGQVPNNDELVPNNDEQVPNNKIICVLMMNLV